MTATDLTRALPDIDAVHDRSRALAMLDAIMASPDGDHLYYSFDPHWAPGRELASMDNGSGDAYSIVFSPAGAFVRGFDHESPMSPYATDDDRTWPGLIDTVPAVFADCLAEPAFRHDGFDTILATVVLWRQATDERWHTGDVTVPDDGEDHSAGWMFDLLTDLSPESWVDFAADYWERTPDLDAVREVCALTVLTDELVRRINPGTTLAAVRQDATAIGYPVA